MSTEKKINQFEAKNLEWLEYVKGNDTCKKPGCYGRGWTGFKADGTPVFCSCAVVSTPSQVNILKGQQDLQTEFKKLIEKQEAIKKESEQIQSLIVSKCNTMYLELRNHIDYLIESRTFRSEVKKQVRKRIKGAL